MRERIYGNSDGTMTKSSDYGVGSERDFHPGVPVVDMHSYPSIFRMADENDPASKIDVINKLFETKRITIALDGYVITNMADFENALSKIYNEELPVSVSTDGRMYR